MGLDRGVAVTKILAFIPLLLVAAPESDQFNCPEPRGAISLEEGWEASMPSHIDKIMPPTLELDVVCRINSIGRLVDCQHSPRQELTVSQSKILDRMMSRLMRSYISDVPNQSCVATKINLGFPGGEVSKTPPHEPAR